MRYFPILQELFESDTVIFLAIGFIIAFIFGMWLKNLKAIGFAVGILAVVYAVCEWMSNMHTNFLMEILLLFLGTFSIGGFLGLLLCLLIKIINKQRRRKMTFLERYHVEKLN